MKNENFKPLTNLLSIIAVGGSLHMYLSYKHIYGFSSASGLGGIPILNEYDLKWYFGFLNLEIIIPALIGLIWIGIVRLFSY